MTHLPDTTRHLVNLFNDAKYGEPPLNGRAPGTGRKRLTRYKTSQGNWIRHLSAIVFVQSLNHVWPFVTPWTTARQASLSFTIFQSLLKLMTIELVMPSNHLILCHPLLLLPSIFPSNRVFSNESALCIQWPKYWSFTISPLNEYSELISFRIDWFDLLAVQGTLKSFLLHHNWKISILQGSAFIEALISIYDYWKNHSFDYMNLCLQSDVSICFLICCLGLWKLSFLGAGVFQFHGCSHHPQWFWSPRK